MQAFRRAIEASDLDALVSLFADDIVFRSPVVHHPYHGPDQVKSLLRSVGEVLEGFEYTRVIGCPEEPDHALVFRALVGDRQVEGCDFIHLNDDGLIDEFYVMIRPISGVMALAERMRSQLAESGHDAST